MSRWLIPIAMATLLHAGPASAELHDRDSTVEYFIKRDAARAAATGRYHQPSGGSCRREPIRDHRQPGSCKPTSRCADREVKAYRTVCD